MRKPYALIGRAPCKGRHLLRVKVPSTKEHRPCCSEHCATRGNEGREAYGANLIGQNAEA